MPAQALKEPHPVLNSCLVHIVPIDIDDLFNDGQAARCARTFFGVVCAVPCEHPAHLTRVPCFCDSDAHVDRVYKQRLFLQRCPSVEADTLAFQVSLWGGGGGGAGKAARRAFEKLLCLKAMPRDAMFFHERDAQFPDNCSMPFHEALKTRQT